MNTQTPQADLRITDAQNRVLTDIGHSDYCECPTRAMDAVTTRFIKRRGWRRGVLSVTLDEAASIGQCAATASYCALDLGDSSAYRAMCNLADAAERTERTLARS